MTKPKPKLRVLLDEGVPTQVAQVFEDFGHEVLPFEAVLKKGADDVLVCVVAEANDAILVAFDKDMKAIALNLGISGGRFKKLSLIRFRCLEAEAASRLQQAMTLIEHEWVVGEDNERRLFVTIGKETIQTRR